jgi:TPP-dependent pyruvate/acetoin dehydrogenase alpha subunit
MTSTLRPIAVLARSLPADRGFALIPNRRLYELYALMTHARLLAGHLEKLGAKHPGSSPVAESRGCEAFLAATILGLDREDTLAPGTGGLVPASMKGLPSASLRALLAGANTRIDWQRRGIVLPGLELAAQLDEALTVAEANKKSGHQKLVLVLCGNPQANEKTLKKAMKRAGRDKLPVLFVAHSALGSPEFAATAAKCGFPGIVADASDAVAVYRVATESAAHARRGNGATLIECRPWPLADAPADAIEQMEEALRRRGIFSQKLRKQTVAAFKQQLAIQ